eukprot:TRINITY_DN5570_c0_g1_i1.p1 TRINITY_DN5570_c0_g1~~TRINITY_DN5570_c0_g1_i1.p1  ORF type:complete len:1254 (+),score=279.86 TRINITY_DN5570_c0_g1_i1:91-3852(+)
MVLDIKADLYSFLVEFGVLSGPVPKRKGYVRLDAQSSALFENGLAVATLLDHICKRRKLSNPLQESLKSLSTPVAKLYNWNLLISALAKLSVHVDPDMKSLIVAGDTDLLVELLCDIQSVSVSLTKSPITKPTAAAAKSPVLAKSPAIPEGAVHFVAQLLADALHIKLPRAIQLLTSNLHELSGLTNVGARKRDYEPILKWYQSMFAQGGKLVQMLALEPRAVVTVLSALRTGLLSLSNDVAMMACRVLTGVGYEIASSVVYSDAWKWFITPVSGGLDAVIDCVRRSDEMKLTVFPIVEQFCKKHLHDLFSTHLRTALPKTAAYLVFIHELFLPLAESRAGGERLVAEGVVQYLLDISIKYADGGFAMEERLAALGLVTDVWRLFPDQVEQKQDGCRLVLTVLKKGCRDVHTDIQVLSLGYMFGLLDSFIPSHNAFAPVLYKTLIFCLIENNGDDVVREYTVANMTILLETQPSIPVGILVEPLVKQLLVRGYTNTHFDFLIALSKHARLSVKHALMLLDVFGKMSVSDALHGRVATVPLLIILTRFHSDQQVVEYIEQYGKLVLTLFINVEKRNAQTEQKLVEAVDTSDVRQMLILEVLAKIVHLNLPKFNTLLRGLIKNVQTEYVALFGGLHTGLRSLMQFFKDVVEGQVQQKLFEPSVGRAASVKATPMTMLTTAVSGSDQSRSVTTNEPPDDADNKRKALLKASSDVLSSVPASDHTNTATQDTSTLTDTLRTSWNPSHDQSPSRIPRLHKQRPQPVATTWLDETDGQTSPSIAGQPADIALTEAARVQKEFTKRQRAYLDKVKQQRALNAAEEDIRRKQEEAKQKRIKEKLLNYSELRKQEQSEYRVPSTSALPASYSIAYEILDAIMLNAIGLHVLEPTPELRGRNEKLIVFSKTAVPGSPTRTHLPADYMSLAQKRKQIEAEKMRQVEQLRKQQAQLARKQLQQRSVRASPVPRAGSGLAGGSVTPFSAPVMASAPSPSPVPKVRQRAAPVPQSTQTVLDRTQRLFGDSKKADAVAAAVEIIALVFRNAVAKESVKLPPIQPVSLWRRPLVLERPSARRARSYYHQKRERQKMERLGKELHQRKKEDDDKRRLLERQKEIREGLAKLAEQKRHAEELVKQEELRKREAEEAMKQANAKIEADRRERERVRLQEYRYKQAADRERRWQEERLAEETKIAERKRQVAEWQRKKATIKPAAADIVSDSDVISAPTNCSTIAVVSEPPSLASATSTTSAAHAMNAPSISS